MYNRLFKTPPFSTKQAPRPFFHTFEGNDAVFGLSFADEGEARDFLNQVNSHKPSGPPASINPTSPQSTSPAPVVKQQPSNNSHKAIKKKKPSMFGFGKLFAKEDDTPLQISEPSNFEHRSSIGWSHDKGFEIRNIPPDWKKLFQQAGIKKGELKNVETAQYVMDIIQQNGGVDKIEEEIKSGPLPSAPAPPPPMAPNAPPAPPPPSAPPAPSVGVAPSRGGLLSQIQTGTQLRHVDTPEPTPVAQKPAAAGMVGLLAQAMDSRRQAIGGGGGDEDEDSDWSDEGW